MRQLYDFTLREINETCNSVEHCNDCPFSEQNVLSPFPDTTCLACLPGSPDRWWKHCADREIDDTQCITINPEDLRPKGKWIEQTVRGNLVMVCSACHCDSNLCYEQNYCPNCGARMED